MVASRDENKPPNKLVVYPLTVPSGRGVQLSPVSTKNIMEPLSEHPVPWAVLLFREPSQMRSATFPRPSDNSPTF